MKHNIIGNATLPSPIPPAFSLSGGTWTPSSRSNSKPPPVPPLSYLTLLLLQLNVPHVSLTHVSLQVSLLLVSLLELSLLQGLNCRR